MFCLFRLGPCLGFSRLFSGVYINSFEEGVQVSKPPSPGIYPGSLQAFYTPEDYHASPKAHPIITIELEMLIFQGVVGLPIC